MTPSEAHDSARNRDAGHDELQAAVYRESLLGTKNEIVYIGEKKYTLDYVHIEYPIEIGGRIAAWADIIEIYSTKMKEGEARFITEFALKIYEIKPKIWSVGAVIRQCKTIEGIALKWRPNTWGDSSSPRVRVCVVALASDPKLPLLQEMYDYVSVWPDETIR